MGIVRALSLVAVPATLWVLACGPGTAPPGGEPPVQEPPAPVPPPASAARDPMATDRRVVEEARRHLKAGGREATCGPYAVWTDVLDGRILELCQRLAAPLDITYQQRFGLQPKGNPAEGILLFDEAADFRAFARQRGRRGAGYAGFSDGSKGFVALYVEGLETAQLAQTLAHELTHLVSRRALGPGLPPWLSEGLADAIGDGAGRAGLGALEGLQGVEGPAKRLRLAYSAGRVPSLERLAGLRRDQFDGGIISYDYEQSALFVRYLLLTRELAPGFRQLLRRLAGAEPYASGLVTESLGRSWAQLDEGLEAWLVAEFR